MNRRKRVLVVEDDETLRETIGDVMVDDGHEVRLAADGHEALEQLAGWNADVVILDLMMPRMDAYAFRDRHLQTPAGRSAKVLIVSAATDIAAAADRLGAAAWLAKPFTLDDMVDTVNGLLHGDPPFRPNGGTVFAF